MAVNMAGWLFADLLLVLFLVGIGTQSSFTTPPPRPPAVSAEPHARVEPPPPPPSPPGLAKEPVSIPLKVRYGALLAGGQARRQAGEELRMQVIAALADREKFGGSRAGMVLIWSKHDNSGTAIQISNAVAEELPEADRQFFGDSLLRAFWRSGRAGRTESRTELEIYLLK